MRRRAARFALLLTLAAITVVAAQEPAPGPAQAQVDLVRALIAAPDADARQRMLADHASRIDIPLYEALLVEANARLLARRFDEALRGYETGLAMAERLSYRRGVAAMLSGIGTVHGRQGNYRTASTFLLRGMAISEDIGDLGNVETAVNNLGIVHRLQGEYEEALRYYARALKTAESQADQTGVPRTLNNIGIVHMQRGSYREALRYYQESLRLKESLGLTADIPTSLDNIGSVHEYIGNPEAALEYYERSLALNERLQNRRATSTTLSRIGRAHANAGRIDLGLQYLERALALDHAIGQQAQIGSTLHGLGFTYALRGSVPQALDYYSRSLEVREAINDRPGVAETSVEIARVLRRAGRLDDSIAAALRASRVAGETGNRETFWKARVAAGESYRAMGQPTRAREAFDEAIDIIEALRGDVAGGERERQRFLEGKLVPYHGLAAILIGERRFADALAVAERGRARVMLDVLSAGRTDVRLMTLDERDRERALERDMAGALSRVWAEAGKAPPDVRRLAELDAGLRKARAAHATFRAELYDAQPVLKLSRGEADPGSLADAAEVIDDRTALVEFLVTDTVTHLFVVTRAAGAGAQLRVVTLDLTADDVRARTERFRRQLASRDLDLQQAAHDLYQRLLAPAAPELSGKTTLIIVPDAALWELPFQALQPRPGRYLIEDAAVSYAPSIAVLREIRRSRSRDPRVAPATLVALGDPRPAPDGEAGRSVLPASLFAPLPDAARQVRSLGRLYGAEHSRVLTGADATEEQLRSSAGSTSVLHLATHGLIDNASPMHSFLLLSGESDRDAARDGRLEAWEIMNLKLRSHLVVLAACETARGRIGEGEGVIGLSWAFFLAGSPRTVVSLWKVETVSTTELLLAFHRRVRDGLARAGGDPGAAAAMRTSALSLIKDPRYRHPFYWAGFVVIGDGS